MNALKYPELDRYVIIFQSICGLLLACSLAVFVHIYDSHNALNKTLLALDYRTHELRRLETKIRKFEELNEAFQNVDTKYKENLWHDVEAAWNDIPFGELVYRLNTIYLPENYFVLKSFEAHSKEADENKTGQVDHGNLPGNVRPNKTFNIKGWALCGRLDDFKSRSF